MTTTEFIAKLDVVINTFEAELIVASEELALSAMALVVNRIQREGIAGKKYSVNKLPAFFYYDRWLNAGGKALYESHTKKHLREGLNDFFGDSIKLKKSKVDNLEDGISYEEWRIANGLQVNHVDLTFSGRMFQNLGIIATKKVGSYYVTVIGGTNPEIVLRLEYNAIRYGDFLTPNKEEIDLLQRQFVERIENFIKTILT